MKPTIGRIVLYRTDGRNGLTYDLPAIITCTRDSHPGDYPPDPNQPGVGGKKNPLPVPESDTHVHLTVFTPGGFGSTFNDGLQPADSGDWPGKPGFNPGSGTYVEWNVPFIYPAPEGPEYRKVGETKGVPPRTWRWPVIER